MQPYSADHVRGFVRQLDVYFKDHEGENLTEERKCSKVFSFLTGKAIEWASAIWDNDLRLRTSYAYFIQQLREVFEYPAGGRSASAQIIPMSQNHRPIAEYSIEFRTLAAQSGWNDNALKEVFQNSLDAELQAELACKGESSTFSEYITLTIHIDNLMRNAPARPKGRASSNSQISTPKPMNTPVSSPTTVEPMQLGYAPISSEEHERRRDCNLCFYCGNAGHRRNSCPAKTPHHAKPVSPLQTIMPYHKVFTQEVSVLYDNVTLSFSALIDSGSALNLIH